jgi:hypothetical protein
MRLSGCPKNVKHFLLDSASGLISLTELYHLPFFGGEKRAIFGIYSPGLD